ncbi:hypothetical protein N0V88_007518 [Collariella sp. IMI 366227]|nr:hypothetical protein N0V88_007518 [Collariella sp. IMI 366227]
MLITKHISTAAGCQRMDDPSESCWTWPYWKFGLKKDDLFGNIIANPSLIGTEQWQHAVQLFRTKSLDSLVRYFASYLPGDHPWYRSSDSSDAGSSVGSLTDSHGSEFEDEDGPLMTEEPFEYPSYPKQLLPASPRSMTMCSDSSVASPVDEHHDFDFHIATPARSMSFSESEPDCCAMPAAHCHCRQVSRCVGFQLTTTHETITDGVGDNVPATEQVESGNNTNSLLFPTFDTTDSETPTPKPESHTTSFFADTKLSPIPHRRYRSLSPSRPHPLSERDLDESWELE